MRASVAESADAADLKSVGSNTVWVQVPPFAPNKLCKWIPFAQLFVFAIKSREKHSSLIIRKCCKMVIRHHSAQYCVLFVVFCIDFEV